MPPADRRALQDAYRLLYRSGLAPKRALDRVRAEVPPCPPVAHLVEFIEGATRHGICGPPRGNGGEDDRRTLPTGDEENTH